MTDLDITKITIDFIGYDRTFGRIISMNPSINVTILIKSLEMYTRGKLSRIKRKRNEK